MSGKTVVKRKTPLSLNFVWFNDNGVFFLFYKVIFRRWAAALLLAFADKLYPLWHGQGHHSGLP